LHPVGELRRGPQRVEVKDGRAKEVDDPASGGGQVTWRGSAGVRNRSTKVPMLSKDPLRGRNWKGRKSRLTRRNTVLAG